MGVEAQAVTDFAVPKVTTNDSGSASREPLARQAGQPQGNLASRAAVLPPGEHTGRLSSTPDLLERDLQAKCVAWWNKSGLSGLLFHVPNEGKRGRLEAAALGALGVMAGVADFVLLLPEGRVHLIELKRPGGTQSTEQYRFEAAAKAMGHTYDIAQSLDDFKAVVFGASRWWSTSADGHLQRPASSLLEIGAAIPLP